MRCSGISIEMSTFDDGIICAYRQFSFRYVVPSVLSAVCVEH